MGTSPCIFKLGDSFYDYTPLKLVMAKPMVPYYDGKAIISHTTPPEPLYQFVFGWCQQLDDIADPDVCMKGVFAGRLDADPEPTAASECMAYSGGNAKDDIATEEITGKPTTVKRIKARDTSTLSGVKLTYQNGVTCAETGRPTKFSLNMYCNEDMGIKDYDISPVLGNLCEPYIDTVSKAACARISVSQLWGYLADYSEYFGAFLLIAGTLLVFLGRKLFKPAICLTGFLTTIAVSCLIYYSVYLEDTSDLAEFWYFLGGGAAAGICVGLLLCWASRVGAAVLAGWGGLTGALILNETLIYRAEVEWLFWVTIVVCTVGAAVSAFFFLDHVLITSTVLLGSYALVRGVACYAGHYYNEVTMAKLAKEGLLVDIDPWYWAYVGGFFVMLAVGMLVQCHAFKKEKAKKAQKAHPYYVAKDKADEKA